MLNNCVGESREGKRVEGKEEEEEERKTISMSRSSRSVIWVGLYITERHEDKVDF